MEDSIHIQTHSFTMRTMIDPLKIVFVIGDVHGNYSQLSSCLSYFRKLELGRKGIYIFLGDIINKGPESIKCIDVIIELSRIRDTISLQGNHEQAVRLLLKYGQLPGQHYWEHYHGLDILTDLGREKIDFSHPSTVMKSLSLALGKNRVRFFNSLAPNFCIGKFFFTHAGINLGSLSDPFYLSNWESTSQDHWCWAKPTPYVNCFSQTHPTILVHGHTPVNLDDFIDTGKVNFSNHLHSNYKINLDGGNFMGGYTMACALEVNTVTLAAAMHPKLLSSL